MKSEVIKQLEILLDGKYIDRGEYSSFKFNTANVELDCLIRDDGQLIHFENWDDKSRLKIWFDDSIDEVKETVVDLIIHAMSEYHENKDVLYLGAACDLKTIPKLLGAMND